MFRNYLIIAWRNIIKHKTFSFINIGGLAVGIAAVILIGLYIQSEISYDDFQVNRSNIYRAGFSTSLQDNPKDESPEFTAPFSVDAQKQFPEIQSYCRISESHEAWFLSGDKSIKTNDVKFADGSFFQIFSFKLSSGNPLTALQNPYSVVLSEKLADKIFGNDEAVGKTILLDGKTNYLVTGVSENTPPNSTIQYDAVASIATLYNDPNYFMGWNGGWQYQHYFQLRNNAVAPNLEKKFKNFLWTNFNEKYSASESERWYAHLQPLSKIHMYYSADAANTRTNIYVFSIVALLILIISCINYINLSVAHASSRFKEVGVRKVLGALKMQLVKQFMGETFLVTFLALLFAIVITIILFPVYQNVSGKSFILHTNEIVFASGFILLLMILISVAAGWYLSFYLSSLNAINIFKMQLPKYGKQRLGNVLIVFQFIITTALVSAVFIVQMQMQYIKNKPLGFDKEHIIVLSLTGDDVQKKAVLLKQQISILTGISGVSAMSEVPYDNITQNGFLPEGRKDYLTIHQLDADEDLLKTMNIHLLAGNYFSDQHQTDADGYIINQSLADKLGWKNPLNKTINRNGVHKVIGVVQNFHFASMHDQIGPLIITNKPWLNQFKFLVVKYNTENPSLLIGKLQGIWKQNVAAAPFDYWFLDAAFNTLYKAEEKYKLLFFCFSILSIVLSLAGVFGLVLLTLQYKTKEIGIRKVLGAGVADIMQLTAKKFFLLIVFASLVAVPVAWYYVNTWLQNFAYRIELKWWMFFVSGIIVLLFALIIISIQSIKAAIANPVKSLRTE
ncbi:macrolide export ATP-binding/permease protein MacB [mine drainage metagenome]|uniref:Macrolide export ATP-binding/permease protein MacB n=1 Tax=mine drainage metagenome TaxID=410659 RepID=A0A1J5SG27_9ZZZZ